MIVSYHTLPKLWLNKSAEAVPKDSLLFYAANLILSILALEFSFTSKCRMQKKLLNHKSNEKTVFCILFDIIWVIFRKLWDMATNPNSISTLSIPLSVNLLNLLLNLICPNTASGSMGRLLR